MQDSYWVSAIQFLSNHVKDKDAILAPNALKQYFQNQRVSNYRATFLGLNERHFDWVVLHKGMLNRIQPDVLSAIDHRFLPVFVNEVFIVFSKELNHSTRWMAAVPADSPHLQAYWIMRQQMLKSPSSSYTKRGEDDGQAAGAASRMGQSNQDMPTLNVPNREFVPDIDVLLCSYRKCGRTWLRFILSCYINQLCHLGYEPSWDTMGILVPAFKLSDEIPLDTICIHQYVGCHGLRAIAASHQHYANPNAPKILAGKDIIFLFRSVGDVLVSQYFERVFRRDFHPRDSVWAFIQAEHLLEAYISYLNAWANNLANHHHITLTYEALKQDTTQAVTRVLKFIGAEVNQEFLERAIALSSFENMQKIERQGLGLAETSDETASLRTRRGKIGGYRDYLSNEAVTTIRQYCHDYLSSNAKALFDAHKLDIV